MLAQNFKSAAELRIADDVHSALAKVLVLLETEAIVAEEFRMDWWPNFESKGCWSGGCIGGWAEKVGGFEITTLGDNALYDLFFPEDHRCAHSPYLATPAEGARALRNYLTTGKSSWPEVMRARSKRRGGKRA